jgi:hypothetical protein
LISHFTTNVGESVQSASPLTAQEDLAPVRVDPDIAANQVTFAQKASNPQASLQPWLEDLLDGAGVIRCYATEDPNPTKQLKNKLSQAASARGGLLVLLLSDEVAFQKARDALVDRWMTNDEWPKSVSCAALAYPLADAVVRVAVEHAHSPWPGRLRARLFPSLDLVQASGASEASGRPTAKCTRCSEVLPERARFCSACGHPVREPES